MWSSGRAFATSTNLEELAETTRLHEEALEAAVEIGAVGTLTELWDNLSLYCYLLGDFSEAESHARRSLASKRRLGQPLWAMHISLFVLSGCARAAGDFEQLWAMHISLFVLSGCARAAGDFERSALLAGAFERAEAEGPAHFGSDTWTEMDQRAHAANRGALEVELGAAARSSALAAGARMSLDQVVGLALGRGKPADLGIGRIPSEP